MREPRIVLALFCAVLLVTAAFVQTHGAPVVDVRTYIEMIAGVAQHGLPYLDNGPVDRFSGLEVPFGVSAGGHLWGMYGPVYPYFGAPFLRLGGLTLVSRATFALLVPTAIATYALARTLIRDEGAAVLAAMLTVGSTPLLAKGWAPTAYPIAVLFIVTASALAASAIRKPMGSARRAQAMASGLAAGLAGGSHLLCVPMALALMTVLLFVDASPDAFAMDPSAPFWRSLLPSRTKLQSSGAFGAGLALCIAPFSWLNVIRFHSWNPFSYGPHRWRWGGFSTDTMGQQLAFAAPSLGFLAGVTVVFLVTRNARTRWGTKGMVLVFFVRVTSVLLFLLSARLRHDVNAMARVACAIFVDLGLLKLDGYGPAPGTFGAITSNWVVKSMTQATPFLLLGVLMRRLDRPTRHGLLCVAAPCIALFAYLLMRANLPPMLALGFPFINARYTLPALPMLVVIAMLAIRDVRVSMRHVAAIIAIGAGVAWILGQSTTKGAPDDRPLFQQVILLVVPFVTAVVAAMAIAYGRARPTFAWAAPWSVVPCMAIGMGIAIGHDLRLEMFIERGCDARVDAVAEIAPSRFAVVGELGVLDGVLPLRASRDIEYTEPHQWERFGDMRGLLDHWFADNRPIFLLSSAPPQPSPWSDIAFDLVDSAQGVYRFRRLPTP